MPDSRVLTLAFLATLAVAGCTEASDPLGPTPQATSLSERSQGIEVMSQNLYLGANLDLLLSAKTPAEVGQVFAQLGTSTLTPGMGSPAFGRAFRLAQQIAMEAPHLVGLQEVTRYEITTPLGTQTLDYIDVLQGFLAYFNGAYGTPLYTVIRENWTEVYFPASMFNPSFPNILYTDGDAILVRQDVQVVGAPVSKAYDAVQPMSVAGFDFDYHRGYLAVTAQIGNEQVRFGNTHLEVQLFEDVQVRQTAELIAAFEEETLPVILVGDFNSAANHDADPGQKTASYHMFRNAGYADLWLRTPASVAGYTCCQAADLTNETSELTQRLDLVLVRWGPAGFAGQSTMDIVGEAAADRIDLGSVTLWPSDHAAVTATLWPAPGRTR